MTIVLSIFVESLRSALELGLLVLLPIMAVMLAVMRVLQSRGVLHWVAVHLSSPARVFGLSGYSVFAAFQQLFIGFAAPPATLTLMREAGFPRRRIAATLAMVLTMSQANATFPLIPFGLNLGAALLTSILGGLVASVVAFRLLGAGDPPAEGVSGTPGVAPVSPEGQWWQVALAGVRDAIRLVMRSLPVILVAILVVNAIEALGILRTVETGLAPMLGRVGLPGVAILPVVTKYLAGGTAMMGVALDLVREGSLGAEALNAIAGFTINPLDPVGLAVLIPAVGRDFGVIRAALLGAVVGILIRGGLHLLLFAG